MSTTVVSKNNTKGFIQAVKDNDVGKVRRYVKAGIDISKKYNYDEENPLMLAIMANNAEMVRAVLEGGALVNALVEIHSILYEAVGAGNVQIVELLLQAGADPNFQSMSSETPLFKAVELQSVKLVQLLCENNANPAAKDSDGRTPKDIAATERVLKALEVCVGDRKPSVFSTTQVLNQIRQSIQTKGTFIIQSQKTGQCFSDSFQHVLYYADGIAPYFIQRALDKGKASLTLPVTRENFLTKATTSAAVTLYLDYTGVRFLEMFLKPLLIQAPQKGKMVRRPSVVSVRTSEPLGIVCSQALNIYRVIQETYKEEGERRQGIEESDKAYETAIEKIRAQKREEYPLSLNSEGFGYLTDSMEYEFWTDVLNRIPASLGISEIRGETESRAMDKYKMSIATKRNVKYRIPLDSIVGILFSIFPLGNVMRDFSAGHALALVKTFGKWYLCDDNVGYALPVKAFSMQSLIDGQLTMKFTGTKIIYSILDKFKIDEFVGEEQRRLGSSFLDRYVSPPESFYMYPLAEVTLSSRSVEKTFQESSPGGEGGFMDISFSRKYIGWTPV